MNLNINLSQVKEKFSANVVIIVVLLLLAVVLGYFCWNTFDEGENLKAGVSQKIVEYNNNRSLLRSLKDLKANSNYYLAQKEKYDEVIAEADTYNTVDYYVEISNLCESYELTIQELEVGDLVPMGTVQMATTTLVVVGEEIDVKLLAEHIITQQEIARIDSITMAEQEDGTVVAALTIVNFTK